MYSSHSHIEVNADNTRDYGYVFAASSRIRSLMALGAKTQTWLALVTSKAFIGCIVESQGTNPTFACKTED
jgi:hypothetical protein